MIENPFVIILFGIVAIISYVWCILTVKDEVRQLQLANSQLTNGKRPYEPSPSKAFNYKTTRRLAENRFAIATAYVLAPILVLGGAIFLIAYAMVVAGPLAMREEIADLGDTMRRHK